MEISKSTYELLLPINAAINNNVNVTSVVTNNNGTFTLNTCNTLWATIGFPVKINNFEYKIKSVVNDVSITVKPVTGNTAPVVGVFPLYVPKFYHGTITATEVDLNKRVNDNLLWSDKLPMIWLHEPTDEDYDPDSGNAIALRSHCDIYFLIDADFAKWNNDDHYNFAIKPMRKLFAAFYEAMKYSGLVNESLITGLRITPLPRFGRYTAVTGSKDQSNSTGTKNTIFAQFEMSGIRTKLTIPWIRTDGNCCVASFISPDICLDAVVVNSDNSFSHSIASGGTYTLPNQTVNITQNAVVIDSFTFVPMSDATGTVTPPTGDCDNAIVKNSNNSFMQSVAAGGDFELEDQVFDVYVNGVYNTSFTIPSMKNETVNLIVT